MVRSAENAIQKRGLPIDVDQRARAFSANEISLGFLGRCPRLEMNSAVGAKQPTGKRHVLRGELDPVSQGRPVADSGFELVAGVNRTNPRRRSRKDHVTWQKGD